MLEIVKVNYLVNDNKVGKETLFSLNGTDGEYTWYISRKISGHIYRYIRLGIYSLIWDNEYCKANLIPSKDVMIELSNMFGLSFDNIKLSTESDGDELY